jgi:DNA helicase II / ATP-dependent DNA helicase PcrA
MPEPDLAAAVMRDLNDRQRAAVSHGAGPLLVVAGAGTGKTATLAHRVAWLIAEGARPERILLLTFTRRAAAEMLSRVDGILRRLESEDGASALSGKRVWGGTFHAVAARLLRIHAESIGLDPGFTIMDRGDSEDMMNVVRGELDLSRTDRRFPQKGTCLDIYSRCVNADEPLADALARHFPWCKEHEDDLKRLFAGYTDRKEACDVLDYDDLLLFWNALLEDEAAGALVRERFDHVLVDEYQDTNALQASIVKLLRPDGSGVTVVGDDAQAIYGFRAATVRNILDFPAAFPGTELVALEQNYRSAQGILAATNEVIAEAAERHEKALWTSRSGGGQPSLVTCRDEAEQTAFVVDRVLEHREQGVALRRQAVLFRAAHHSAELELELAQRNVPFHKYGGLKFVESAHVKDLVAFLRLAENPVDLMAGTRALSLVPGIGPKSALEMMARLAEAHGDFTAWADERPPAAARVFWPDLVSLMRRLHAEPPPLASQLAAVRDFYRPLLEQRYDNVRARLTDLEQLEAVSARYTSRERFLAELVLDAPGWTGDLAGPPHLDEDWLVLSTIHSAKGLEFDAVYVIHAADGNIPSDMACGSADEIEEERRLFYVACTRARDHLYVTVPLRYYVVGKGPTDRHGYAQPSRFISERVKPHFHSTTAGPPEPADAPVRGGAAADVRARVRRMWA